MKNRVIHFEIPCDHPQKVMDFFSEVFHWRFEQFGDVPYWSAITGDENAPGINGGIMQKRDPRQPIAHSIYVEDIDAYIVRVAAAGGEIVVPKMAVPGMGWLAYFKDPDGNIHGMFQEDSTANYMAT